MAFAAARMLKDKKDQKLKRSQEALHNNHGYIPRTRSKLNIYRGSRSPSISSSRTGFSQLSDNTKAKSAAKNVQRSGKAHPGRSTVKCVKKIKGKKGGPDRYELIVTLDLAGLKLNDEQLAEYKEVFMLFDKDEDGVLSFAELNVVMKSLGQRPSESQLLSMVRSVSEDTLYDTIEFNEFLQMMSKQQNEQVSLDSLIDAFRIFDKDEDGKLSVPELKQIMSSLGEKMAGRELEQLVDEADTTKEGFVNYEDFCNVLVDDKKAKSKKGAASKGKRLDHNKNIS